MNMSTGAVAGLELITYDDLIDKYEAIDRAPSAYRYANAMLQQARRLGDADEIAKWKAALKAAKDYMQTAGEDWKNIIYRSVVKPCAHDSPEAAQLKKEIKKQRKQEPDAWPYERIYLNLERLARITGGFWIKSRKQK